MSQNITLLYVQLRCKYVQISLLRLLIVKPVLGVLVDDIYELGGNILVLERSQQNL